MTPFTLRMVDSCGASPLTNASARRRRSTLAGS
jgi:hypothetical protein